MALALRLTQEQYDAAAAEQKPLYRKVGDGYVLDVNPDEAETVFAGPLKRALDQEKEDRRKAREKLQERESLFHDLGIDDPEELKGIVAKHREQKDKELIDAGEVDKLIANKVEAATKRMRDAYTTQVQTLEQERDTYKTNLHQELVVSKVMAGCAAHGVRARAADDVLARASKVFKVNAEGKVVPLGPDGQVVRGKDGEPLTFDEWFDELAKTDDHLFVPSNGGGAANPQSAGGRPAGSHAGLRRSLMSRKQRSDFISEFGSAAYEQLPP